MPILSRAPTIIVTADITAKHIRLSLPSPQHLSLPRQVLGAASHTTEPLQTFELRFLELQLEA
jgi:hypothetical protein